VWKKNLRRQERSNTKPPSPFWPELSSFFPEIDTAFSDTYSGNCLQLEIGVLLSG
jgi:hypothetical protein